MLANVNVAGTCNAFFNGTSINFFAAGGTCPNLAYSTVITHEAAHWLNVLYGTDNSSLGMGEGNADAFATYVHDTAIIGEDFCGSGCNIRTGESTRQCCGDCCEGCHGTHWADGEVWMGAAWKVRSRLNATLGNALGDEVANGLFVGWLNAYDQTATRPAARAASRSTSPVRSRSPGPEHGSAPRSDCPSPRWRSRATRHARASS